MTALSVFIPQLNSIQTPGWPVLYVYRFVTSSLSHQPSSPILKWLKTQQTDQQYSYYDKNVKGCFSCEIVCVEHDTLMSLQVSLVFQNTHL